MDVGREADGVMQKDQVMRWILEGVGGEGVTIRLCIKSGKIRFYVSYLPNPSEVMNENQGTIAATSQLAVSCNTHFVGSIPAARRKRSSQSSFEKIYISIIGKDEESVFSLSTSEGNITIGKRLRQLYIYATLILIYYNIHTCIHC